MTLQKFKMITKPFWIPAVTLIYVGLTDRVDIFVCAALFFGWVGDLLLMRGRKHWFIAGAVSFFIGHIFYSKVFITEAGGISGLTSSPLFTFPTLLPYIAYLFIVKKILGKNVKSVFPAAAAYLSSVMLMSWSSLQRFGDVPRAAFLLTFCGSVLFIISDSLIGIRNLKRKFKGSGVLVVVTYIAAQLMIVGGLSF